MPAQKTREIMVIAEAGCVNRRQGAAFLRSTVPRGAGADGMPTGESRLRIDS